MNQDNYFQSEKIDGWAIFISFLILIIALGVFCLFI